MTFLIILTIISNYYKLLSHHILVINNMSIELKIIIVLLLACASISKPAIANKVILALNCGSKDQEVESADKIFKYKPD